MLDESSDAENTRRGGTALTENTEGRGHRDRSGAIIRGDDRDAGRMIAEGRLEVVGAETEFGVVGNEGRESRCLTRAEPWSNSRRGRGAP